MSDVTNYLAQLGGEEKAALERVCAVVRQVAPEAAQGTSYGMPAFKYRDKPLVGFIAAKDHLSLFPFSPSVIETLRDELKDFSTSKGTIRFTVQNPIGEEILQHIIHLRLQEITK